MPRLMIVDDSLIFRNRILRLATSANLDLQVVALARDGQEALELADKHRPEVITMDLTMPRMEGQDCLQQLRGLLPEARVLVVSALSDRATALKAVACGAHGFLLKPFSDAELVASLTELLA